LIYKNQFFSDCFQNEIIKFIFSLFQKSLENYFFIFSILQIFYQKFLLSFFLNGETCEAINLYAASISFKYPQINHQIIALILVTQFTRILSVVVKTN